MKPGQTVWTSNYGCIKRGRLIALDGADALVRRDDGHAIAYEVGELFPSRSLALAAASKARKKNIANRVKTIVREIDALRKELDELVQSLEIGNGD